MVVVLFLHHPRRLTSRLSPRSLFHVAFPVVFPVAPVARVAAGITAVSLVLVSMAVGGCSGGATTGSPTSPSPVGPPAANTPVRYTAIGASDANGVGGSVPCLPFAPCENGTGYVPVLARQLRSSREVTVVNLGIPAAVLSPAIEVIARQYGRDVTGNFVDREMPFVPRDSTLVTIFGGANDANAIGHAIAGGAAGTNIPAYIAAQTRTFGADYDRLIQGIRGRAPDAFMIVINVPNLAALPFTARYSVDQRRVLQAISVAFSQEVNRQAGAGVAVWDLMCDTTMYAPTSLSQDGFHPNDAGYAYLATRLAAIVQGASSPVSTSCNVMRTVPPL